MKINLLEETIKNIKEVSKIVSLALIGAIIITTIVLTIFICIGLFVTGYYISVTVFVIIVLLLGCFIKALYDKYYSNKRYW